MTKIIHVLKLINKHSSFSLDYLKSLLNLTKGDLNYFIKVVIIKKMQLWKKLLTQNQLKNIEKI